MKKNTYFNKVWLFMLTVVVFGACKKDNYAPPSSYITGKLTYNGKAVPFKLADVQVDFFQYGYKGGLGALNTRIQQDGSYSNALYDGDYKMAFRQGVAPFVDRPDTVSVSVKGNTTLDLAVTPFFWIDEPTYAISGTNVTATVNITKVVSTKNLESVSILVGSTQFTDFTNNLSKTTYTAASITNLAAVPVTASLTALGTQKFFYVRISAKTTGLTAQNYSQVVTMTLP